MTDRHHELPIGHVVINAVHHAAPAEGQALAFIILRAAGQRVSEPERAITCEYQTMGGCSGHAGEHTPMAGDRYTNPVEGPQTDATSLFQIYFESGKKLFKPSRLRSLCKANAPRQNVLSCST